MRADQVERSPPVQHCDTHLSLLRDGSGWWRTGVGREGGKEGRIGGAIKQGMKKSDESFE